MSVVSLWRQGWPNVGLCEATWLLLDNIYALLGRNKEFLKLHRAVVILKLQRAVTVMLSCLVLAGNSEGVLPSRLWSWEGGRSTQQLAPACQCSTAAEGAPSMHRLMLQLGTKCACVQWGDGGRSTVANVVRSTPNVLRNDPDVSGCCATATAMHRGVTESSERLLCTIQDPSDTHLKCPIGRLQCPGACPIYNH